MQEVKTLGELATVDLFWERIAERRWGKYISAIERASILQAHQRAGPPATALEIGAASGRWARLLSDLGWQMICTDIDPDVLGVCQQRIPNARCELVEQDDQRFPCSDREIRLLLAIEVHELVEQDWFIEETARTLEKGGVFVGVFQNIRSWRALARNFRRRDEDSFQHYTASYGPWRKKLMGRGFQMLREEGLCWMPFGRMSDSRLVPAAVSLEKAIGLRRLVTWSPWIVFVAQKTP